MIKNILFFLQFLMISMVVSAQSWVELGTGASALNANDAITLVAVDSTGNNVYATGEFTNSAGKRYVAKWDGISWTELGGYNALAPNEIIKAMAVDKFGNVYVGGRFTNAQGEYYIAVWNGISWTELAGSASGKAITSLLMDTECNLYTVLSGSLNLYGWNVYKWNRTSWYAFSKHPLDHGEPGDFLAMDGLGNFYSENAQIILKMINESWYELPYTSLGSIANRNTYTMVADKIGNAYMAGEMYSLTNGSIVVHWNGTETVELGGGIFYSRIITMAVDRDNNLYVYGNSRDANQIWCVSKYDGTNWAYLGSVPDKINISPNGVNSIEGVNSITVDKSNVVYVGGHFSTVETYPKSYHCVAKFEQTTSTPPVTTAVTPQSNNRITIYPNPGTNRIQIEGISEDVELSIYNSLGEIILMKKIMSSESGIDLTKLPSGIYTLLFNGINPLKWIKE
jgi:hypothetical protein